jgi:capsular exopolysaccharide synthesis family protein
MQQPEPEPQLIDLREFMGVLRRRKWSVLLVTILVVGLALALVYRRTPVYTSVAEVEVGSLTLQSGSFYDLQASMDTEAQRVTSAPIARAARQLGAPLDGSVDASIPANTTYLEISCTTTDPQTAKTCADAYAQAYVDARNARAQDMYDAAVEPKQAQLSAAEQQVIELTGQLRTTTDPAERASLLDEIAAARRDVDSYQLQVLAVPAPNPSAGVLSLPGEVPTVPANKGYVTTGILALIAGLALGTGLAFVRERLDEHVGDRQDVELALNAPVLAVVPKVPGWRNRDDSKLVTLNAPNGAASEAYRTARTTLLYLAKEGGLQVFAITGPGQGEGKTTTTANLAVSLAQAGKRVIAVSCDLRKPRLHRFLGVGNDTGISQVLTGAVEIPDALLRTQVPGLLVMPSGPVPANPAELLTSPTMAQLLVELRKVADIVLLDTAPSLVVADALGLAPLADAVVVVADASTTQRNALTHLSSQLERTGGSVIGGVINNLDASDAKRYRAYGVYYGQNPYGADAAPSNGSPNGHERRGRRARKTAARNSLEDAEG